MKPIISILTSFLLMFNSLAFASEFPIIIDACPPPVIVIKPPPPPAPRPTPAPKPPAPARPSPPKDTGGSQSTPAPATGSSSNKSSGSVAHPGPDDGGSSEPARADIGVDIAGGNRLIARLEAQKEFDNYKKDVIGKAESLFQNLTQTPTESSNLKDVPGFMFDPRFDSSIDGESRTLQEDLLFDGSVVHIGPLPSDQELYNSFGIKYDEQGEYLVLNAVLVKEEIYYSDTLNKAKQNTKQLSPRNKTDSALNALYSGQEKKSIFNLEIEGLPTDLTPREEKSIFGIEPLKASLSPQEMEFKGLVGVLERLATENLSSGNLEAFRKYQGLINFVLDVSVSSLPLLADIYGLYTGRSIVNNEKLTPTELAFCAIGVATFGASKMATTGAKTVFNIAKESGKHAPRVNKIIEEGMAAKKALDKIKVPAEGAKDALIASAKKSPESLRKKIERLDISVSQKMEKAGVELTDRKIKFNDDINVTDAIEAAKKNRKHEPSHLADDLAIQGKLSKDTELVRVHGVLTDNEKGAKPSGAWWTHPDVIKGKSPKEIKDVLGLEHEPKYISRVQFKEGTEVLVSNVEKAWGTKGGGIQFKLNVKGEDLEGFIGKQNKIHGPLPLK